MSLAAVVAAAEYKPGWHLDLCTMNGVPHIRIRASVPNSEPPHEPLDIAHVLPIPNPLPTNLRRWVYDQILAVERHELGEWLRWGDDRPFYPSHDGAPDRYEEPPR